MNGLRYSLTPGACSKKGTPIESLTIGAGVPTAEKAIEICDGTYHPSLFIFHSVDVLQLYLPLKRSSSHVATAMLVAHAY